MHDPIQRPSLVLHFVFVSYFDIRISYLPSFNRRPKTQPSIVGRTCTSVSIFPRFFLCLIALCSYPQTNKKNLQIPHFPSRLLAYLCRFSPDTRGRACPPQQSPLQPLQRHFDPASKARFILIETAQTSHLFQRQKKDAPRPARNNQLSIIRNQFLLQRPKASL